MDPETLFSLLEDALSRCGVGIELRDLADDEVNIKSGLCEVEGKKRLIIHRRLPLPARVAVMAGALKQQDLGGIYLSPALRAYLGGEEK